MKADGFRFDQALLDALPPELAPIGRQLAAMARDGRDILNGGVLLKDNICCALVDMSFQRLMQLTSGVERPIANPLAPRGIVPMGFTPVYAEDANRVPLKIAGWQYNTTPRDGGNKVMPGFVGLTVDFELDHAQPCLIKTASAVQSLTPSFANVTLTGWDTTQFSRGNKISDNGSIFTLSEAGTYSISISGQPEPNTYTAFQMFAQFATYTIPRMYLPVAFTDGPIMTISGVVQVAAGDTFVVQALQANGAAAARNIQAGRRIMIQRLYNDTVKTGRVVGILWGG